jgi:hypothetical protein
MTPFFIYFIFLICFCYYVYNLWSLLVYCYFTTSSLTMTLPTMLSYTSVAISVFSCFLYFCIYFIQDGKSPLHEAAMYNRKEVAALLVEKGARIDIVTKVIYDIILHYCNQYDCNRVIIISYLFQSQAKCVINYQYVHLYYRYIYLSWIWLFW